MEWSRGSTLSLSVECDDAFSEPEDQSKVEQRCPHQESSLAGSVRPLAVSSTRCSTTFWQYLTFSELAH